MSRTMLMALLLDLANIAGGLLLAAVLLQRLPRVGGDLAKAATATSPYGWIIGVIALVAGGYYLIAHVVDGQHILHFEVVGIALGLILLWDRFWGRPKHRGRPEPTGVALLLAVFGLIAVLVGLQGLFTPDY